MDTFSSSDQVPAGTVVTVAIGGHKLVVQPIDNFWGSPFATQIAQALGQRLHLYSLNITGGDSASDIITTISGNVYAYTLTAQLSSDVSEPPEAILQAFASAVYAAAGLQPETSSITAIGGTSTGQPVQGPPAKNPIGDLIDSLIAFFQTVPKAATVLLVGGVVLIFVVAFGKDRQTVLKRIL